MNEFTSLKYSEANQNNNWCSTTLDISELFLSVPVLSSLHDTLLYSRDATNSSFDDFCRVSHQWCHRSDFFLVTNYCWSPLWILLVMSPDPVLNHVAKFLTSVIIKQIHHLKSVHPFCILQNTDCSVQWSAIIDETKLRHFPHCKRGSFH